MKKYFIKKRPDFLTPGTRGFNLFSSVVAAILVMSAVVLINTLISTEEKTTNQVSLMVNSFELSDAASLARADALQSFNYFFRERMETWLTCRYDNCQQTISTGDVYDSGFKILNMNNYENWDSLVDTFQNVVLYNDPTKPADQQFDSVIRFIADQTIDRFDSAPYGRYTVSLSDNTESAKEALKNAMSKALQQSSTNGKDFIEVVGCNESSCPVGTFYFNIDLNQVDQDVYEKLPRIIVRDTLSGEEMKTAILPRTNLKIYIPLRFFKVIYEARKQAYAIDSVDIDLRNARLGFCDSGCVPRTNPLDPEFGSEWNKQCPVASGSATQTLEDASASGITLYDPFDATRGLNAYARTKICEASAGLGTIDEGVGMVNYNTTPALNGLPPDPQGGNFITGCPYSSIFVSPKSFDTKNIPSVSVNLNCKQMLGTDSSIIYEEKNPEYIVSGTKLLYKITISTNYPEQFSPSTLGVCKSGITPDNICYPG